MKETFGQRFARLRKEKGLTQDDIAGHIGISAQAVSKWENDISSPDISALTDLADLLGVTTDVLLGKEEDMPLVLTSSEKKDIRQMVMRIRVLSNDGDKVTVNLPLSIVKAAMDKGMTIAQFNSNDALQDIDLNQIFALVEQGVIGELVTVDSADGDHVSITVE